MNRLAQIVVLLIAALLLLTPLTALAQGGEGIELVPFISQEMGYAGLAPQGWMMAGAGAYRRLATENDLAALIQQAAVGYTVDEVAIALLSRLGQAELPADSTPLQANGLAWDLYRIDIDVPELGTVVVDMAFSQAQVASHAIVLQAMLEDYDALHEGVFLPVVEGYAPFSLNWGQQDGPAPIPEDFEPARLQPEVLGVRPHDTGAYTQGLLLYDGSLYESAGRYGYSTLREVEPETGEVLRSIDIDETYFAEGLERVGDRLIQITWKENTAFVYDIATFDLLETYTYEGEGWGLCSDGQYLYMSNGSSFLTLRDPETFEVVDHGAVTFLGRPAESLNELECVGDYIYANVYTTDVILQIDKTNGNVVAVIDATGLLEPDQQAALASGEVLNGIVYLPESETFLITGKHWPSMFEVRFAEAAAE
jgi:glutamine cyclotransferase